MTRFWRRSVRARALRQSTQVIHEKERLNQRPQQEGMLDPGRRSRTVKASCPNLENERDVNQFSRSNRLPQVASRDGESQLPLRRKPAKRTGIRVMVAIDAVGNSRDRRLGFGDRARARNGDMCMFVLASHQFVQALSKQHHPRVEDEHAACKNWSQPSEHGRRSSYYSSVTRATKLRLCGERLRMSIRSSP
jgi:hypothetical protein